MRTPKEVVIIDRRNWEVVKRYPSANAASEDTGVDVKRIYARAGDKHLPRTSFFIFRYADDCKLEDEPIKKNITIPVRVTDTQTGEVTDYMTTLDAAKAFGASEGAILHARRYNTLYKQRYKIERVEVAI